MSKKLTILGAILAVLVPIVAHIRNVTGQDFSLMNFLFPIFGLLAFTLLWLHSISGVFEEKLRQMFDFDTFVRWTALIILVSILLHPLLLLILIKFNLRLLFSGPSLAIWLGIIGLTLLLTYDLGKAIKNEFVKRHWRKILVVSNIGFILTFFHSLMLGSDLQSGFMRGLWLFYGVTAILAIIYTYSMKRFLK